MSSYRGPFDWMLDPRLQQRGMIAPQTAALAQQRGVIPPQGNMVGGYRPPPSPIERYLSQIAAPPQPAAFPAGHPASAIREQFAAHPPAAPGPKQDMQFYSEPAASPKSFTQRLLAETETKKETRGAGSAGPVAQLRSGTRTEQAGILAEGAAASSAAEEKGAHYGEAIAGARKIENTYASIERRRVMSERLAQKNIQAAHEEASLMEKHPAMTPEQARHHQSVIDSPNTTPEQKMRSQASLKKAGEIDPDRIYGGSTGRKVMAAIGMALGAYGAALTKTPNYAMQIVQSAIDNDIAAQREMFASKREGARARRAEAQTDYERIRTKFSDELSRTEALEAVHWRRFARLIEQTSVKYAAPEAKARAMQMYGQAQANAAEKESSIRARESGLELERMKIEASTGGRQAPPGLEPLPGYQPTENDTKKAQELVSSGASLQNAVRRLKSIRERAGAGGFEVLDRDLVNEGKSVSQHAIAAYKQAEALGALDKGSLSLAEGVLGGDPTGVGFKAARYDALIKSITEDLKAKLKPYGYAPSGSEGLSAEEIGAEYID